MMGDYHVRFCEGLKGKFLRATRHFVLKSVAQNSTTTVGDLAWR